MAYVLCDCQYLSLLHHFLVYFMIDESKYICMSFLKDSIRPLIGHNRQSYHRIDYHLRPDLYEIYKYARNCSEDHTRLTQYSDFVYAYTFDLDGKYYIEFKDLGFVDSKLTEIMIWFNENEIDYKLVGVHVLKSRLTGSLFHPIFLLANPEDVMASKLRWR